MGQSAWEQAAEANCGLGLRENLACMEKKSLLQRDLSGDQSVLQGPECTEQGEGLGLWEMSCTGGWSLLRAWPGAKGSTPLLAPCTEGLCTPSIPFLGGFGVPEPGRSLEGFQYLGRRCDLCPELCPPALTADRQRDGRSTFLAAVGCSPLEEALWGALS